ncbi:hypothetical protein BDZ91DRAFT_108718 [Kalaharituber pfeilii]|nr:hypothetical protein BDZ91DRAFT_108718 [Kalaharituber pfeilii]
MAVRYLLQGVQEFKEIGIYIDLQYLTTASLQRLRKYLAFDGSQAGHWHDLTVLSLLEGLQMKEVFDSSKIVELGVYCKCAVIDQRINIHPQSTETKQAPFVYLGEISISTGRFSPYKICSISTDITSSGRTRLSWKIAPHAGACTCDAPGPLSGATGPFAYFIVYSGGEWQGLAFATEFILSKSFIGDTDEVEYTVDGIMWDGTVVASC